MSHPYPHALGRRVEHDPRSLSFAVGVLPRSAIQSVWWTRRVPILDQGNLGSCVGNAITGILGTDAAGRTGYTNVTITQEFSIKTNGIFVAGTYKIDEQFAIKLYSLATAVDEFAGAYPPTDTGSSGVGGSKALQTLGLCPTYQWAFSMAALQSALMLGPVAIGIPWYESMFSPSADGRVRVDRSSPPVGGHELEITKMDLTADQYWFANSWGESWGRSGWGYFTYTDLSTLLAEEGDVVSPKIVTPAPVPAVTDAQLWNTAKLWAAGKGLT